MEELGGKYVCPNQFKIFAHSLLGEAVGWHLFIVENNRNKNNNYD